MSMDWTVYGNPGSMLAYHWLNLLSNSLIRPWICAHVLSRDFMPYSEIMASLTISSSRSPVMKLLDGYSSSKE